MFIGDEKLQTKQKKENITYYDCLVLAYPI